MFEKIDSSVTSVRQRYIKYFFPLWKQFLLIAITMLASSYLDSKTPKLYGQIAQIMHDGNLVESQEIAIQLISYVVISSVCYIISSYLINISGESISLSLREDLYLSIHSMPFWWFAHHKTAKFVALYNNQLHGAHNSITKTIPRILMNILTIVMSIYQLVGSSWHIGAGLLVLLPLFTLLTRFLEKKMMSSERDIQLIKSNMNEHLKNSLSTGAVLTCMNFGLQSHFKTNFLAQSRAMQLGQQYQSWISDIYSRITQLLFHFVFQFGFILVLFSSSTYSDSITLLGIMNKLHTPIQSLGKIKLELVGVKLCFDSIFEQMQQSRKWNARHQKSGFVSPDFTQPIILSKLSFYYHTNEEITT